MVEVGLGVDAVNIASVGIDGREIVFPLLVAHVHRAFVGEEHGITAVAGGHYAVEHINAPLDGFQYVAGCSHAHQVAGLVLWQDSVHHLNHLVHHFCGFSHGKSANGISVGTLVGNIFGSLHAQVFVGAALHNGEECLLMSIERLGLVEALEAPVEPSLSHQEALFGVLIVALSGRALVEGHNDVGSDDALCIYHVLRREDMLRTVDVGTELTSFFAQLADTRQRENLEAA